MFKLVIAKITRLILVLWLVSLGTFFLIQLVPGDPAVAVLGTSGTPEQYDYIREQLGLSKPVVERYFSWLSGIVLHGDFGNSLTPPYASVSSALAARLPVTIQIAALGLILALLLAVPLAVWSAHRQGKMFDRTVSTAVFGVMSLPGFVVALLLIQFFVFNVWIAETLIIIAGAGVLGFIGYQLWRNWQAWQVSQRLAAVAAIVAGLVAVWALIEFLPTFPRQGFSRLSDPAGLGENLRHVALPVFTIALAELALFTRVLRAEMITSLGSDFVQAAKAKGMPTRRVLVREALRPASFSLITVAGLALGSLMGGTLIVEVIFNIPGMGRLLVDAIQANNYTIVQAGVLVLAFIYVAVNTTVDILYAVLDPRVRND